MGASPYGRVGGTVSTNLIARKGMTPFVVSTLFGKPLSTKTFYFMQPIARALLLVFSVTAFQSVANAATKTWNAATGNWSDSGNWSGGLPTASDDVVVDNGGTVTAGNSTYNTGNAVTVGQSDTGILNLVGGATVAIQGGTGTLTLAQNSGSFGTLNIGTGGSAGTLSANHVNGGAGTAVLNFNAPNSNVTFDSQISGSITVNKLGGGTVLLKRKDSAPYENNYTGGTNINGGILSFEQWALGSSGTVAFTGNATLRWSGLNNEDVSGRIKIEDGVTATLDIQNTTTFASAFQTGAAKTGALIKAGAGRLTMGAANVYTGGTTVNSGELLFGNSVATLGSQSLTLNASSTTASVAGLRFSQSAGNATVIIKGGTSINPLGASFSFANTSAGGNGTFLIGGSSHVQANRGTLFFADSSVAGTGTFTINGSTGSGTSGGYLSFANTSNADHGTFVTNGAATAGNGNGQISFSGTSSAGSGNFTTNGASVSGGVGGVTAFTQDASAGNATFVNNGNASGGAGGRTEFNGEATAANASFLNKGATTSSFDSIGQVWITGSATAGNGTFTNAGGTASGAIGGRTQFYNTSTAGNGTFINLASAVNNSSGGETWFHNSSNAGSGTFTTYGTAVEGNSAARMYFLNTSSAGNGTFYINGNSASGSSFGGIVDIQGSASAGNGTFNLNGGTASGAAGGRLSISGTAAAGAATIIANGGTNGGNGSEAFLSGSATGGTATVKVYGNARFSVSGHVAPGVSIGSIEGNGNVILGARNLTVGGDDSTKTFSGVIQDGGFYDGTGGSLTKAGAGTLTLGGNNTYTGGTSILGGSLVLATGGTLGTGAVTNNANLSVNQTASITIPNTISGTGSFIQMGSGSTTLTANNSFAGGTTISAGTLQLGNGGTTGSVAGNIEDNAHLVFNRSNDLTFSGIISGTGDVTKLGGGTLTFTNINTFTGATFVNAGTLTVNGAISGPGGLVSVANGATLNGSGTLNRDITVSSGGTLASSLIVTGQVTVSNQQNVGAVTGGTETAASGQQLNVTTATGGTINATAGTAQIAELNGADLVTGNWGATVTSLTSGNVTTNGGSLVAQEGNFNGEISGDGGLTKSGNGILTLSTPNSYTGSTIVSDGTLVVATSGATGSTSVPVQVVNNGKFRIEAGLSASTDVTTEIVSGSAGAVYEKAVAANESLDNFGYFSSDLGYENATASIGAGTADGNATIAASFSDINNTTLVSDVLSLHGLDGTIFLLVMESALIPNNAAPDEVYLAWYDTMNDVWTNAVEGNDGADGEFAGFYEETTYQEFLADNSGWDPDKMLGAYGMDRASGQVWAVIDHNSDFAAVPEPSSLTLLTLGAAALHFATRRKRQAA